MATRDEQIGQNIVKLRGDRSQQWVADRMREKGWKWAQATVWNVEKGERPLRLAEAEDLADILAVRVERMTYSDMRLNVSIALDKVAGTYQALGDATLAFLKAQNGLALKADSAALSGEELDVDLVEDWLQQLPESVIEDAKFKAAENARESSWQEMHDLGLDSMSQLEKHQLDEAVAAGFDSHAAYQRSLIAHLKFVNLLERSRSGEHPEA